MMKNLSRKWHKWKEIYPLKAKPATKKLAILAGTGPAFAEYGAMVIVSVPRRILVQLFNNLT